MKMKKTSYAIGAAIALAMTSHASADGNRYDRERLYHSEISVSEAYLAVERHKGWKHKDKKKQRKPVLVDVRTLREYASGHPEAAYNIPFPNIRASGDQDPLVFYWEVYDLVKGRLDTPVLLLCRTGSRSIRAGNVLADPESDPATAGLGLPAFADVRNIWEGFVGLYRYGFVNGVPDPLRPLDLNNDKVMNLDAADVHQETKDFNPDKDGWRNFAGLPWTTKIRWPLAYMNDVRQYKALNLTPVD